MRQRDAICGFFLFLTTRILCFERGVDEVCLNFCDPGSNMISWCRAMWERSGLNAFLPSPCKNVGCFEDSCFRVNWKFLGRFLVLRVDGVLMMDSR